MDETEIDARAFEHRGRHIAKQIRENTTAANKAAALKKRQNKEADRVQKATQLKEQRESKAKFRADKKNQKIKQSLLRKGQLIPNWLQAANEEGLDNADDDNDSDAEKNEPIKPTSEVIEVDSLILLKLLLLNFVHK